MSTKRGSGPRLPFFPTQPGWISGVYQTGVRSERYVAKMRKLQNIDVLILDDFLTIGINQRGQEDLTKIIFDRDGRLPTIIVSQTTAAYWGKKLPDPIGADSLVSRLNAGQRIELGDYDMRQHLASATYGANE